MRRIGRILAWIAAAVVGVPLVLVALVLVVGNTAPGQRWIARLTPNLTGGEIHIAGLSGRFPDRLRATTLTIDDKAGPYLTIHNLVFDWSPLRLLHATLDIDRLDAAAVDFARMPQPSGGGKSSGLPVKVALQQFQVDRLTIGAPVAGRPYLVAVNGEAALQSETAGSGRVTVQQIGGSGRYTVDGSIGPQRLQATLTATEQTHGLISGVAGLPDIGPIAISATLDGPRDAVATHLTASAGPLRANVSGTLDLLHNAADLTVAATAPAMTPRPDISWQDVSVHAHAQGPFTAPEISGQVQIDALHAVGAGIDRLTADLSGNQGTAQFHAVLNGFTLPGQDPSLLASAPVLLDATARLDAPDRPVTFTLRHPLVQAQGTASTAGKLQAHVALTLPQLAPLAAAAGQTVQGHTALVLDVARDDATTTIALRGTIGVTGGQAQATALLGDAAQVDLAASLNGGNARLTRLHVTGRGVDVSAHGSLIDARADLAWTVAIADLSAIEPKLNGRIDASGQLSGPEQDLSASAALHGDIGSQGVQSGPVSVQIAANGLPNHPSGTVTAQGALLNAPIDVALSVDRSAGGVNVTVQRADWKSFRAQGALTLPAGATIPQGTLHVQMTQLADLEPLLGKRLSGSIVAALDSSASAAKLTLTAQGLAMPGTAVVARAALDATVTSPQSNPSVQASLTASGVTAGSIAGGTAKMEAHGTAKALAVTLSASAPGVAGSAAKMTAAAMVDAPGRSVALSTLRADWHGETVRLLVPATLAFAQGAAIDHLRLGLRQAVLALNGRISPTLDLTASLANLHADMADAFAPGLKVGGTVAAEARLTGSAARPEGTIRLTASGLRDNSGAGRALPPANLIADATLHGGAAGLNVRLTAGASHVALTGTAPLAATGPLDLRAAGALDLALINPILTAQGRQVKGELGLNASITGTVTAPRIAGAARLTGGEAQDYTMGVHITGISALIQADGDRLRLAQFSGRAGSGSIGASGTVGLAAPLPVDLTITASDARLLASPLITATLDSHLTVQGDAEGNLTAAGLLHVRSALVQVPDKLPSSVAVLPVRVAGEPVAGAPHASGAIARGRRASDPARGAPASAAPQPAAAPTNVALNITLDAPDQVTIRGRGLDVTLGGMVHIRGTAAHPQPSGGLELMRGTMSLVSQTLTFNQGSIDFVGNGIADPGINLVATSSNSSITATLTVSGTAQDPKITLSSAPQLPQDQILAQLLFNQGVGTLSPFQVAEIAAGLAQLSGTGGGVTDPLAGVRNSLGLDQLSVGSGSSGGPTLQAGRSLAPGVYLGAQQSATGNGTQASLQINLAKGLKLETSAGTAAPSATGAATTGQSASVGLTYQFQY